MTAANALLDVMLEPGFFDGVLTRGLYFRQQLAMLSDRYRGIIAEVRGQGLLLAVKTGIQDGEVQAELRGGQVLGVTACAHTVRLLPTPTPIGSAADSDSVC